MASLRSLVVDLQAQNAQLRKGLDDSIARIEAFGDKVDKVGRSVEQAFAFEKLSEAGKKFAAFVQHGAELADTMGKASQAAGTSSEAFSKMAYGAKLSNVSTEDLSGAFSKLNKAMGEAAVGKKEAVALFGALGVSIKDSSGQLRESDVVMTDVAQAFSAMSDGAAKSTLAQELFGKSGAKMIPFLNQGAEGLARAGAEAEKFGLVISKNAAASAEQFNDNLTRLKSAGEGLALKVSEALTPALSEFTDQMVEVAKEGTGVVDVVKAMATAANGVAYAFSVAGTAGAGFTAWLANMGNLAAQREVIAATREELDKLSAGFRKQQDAIDGVTQATEKLNTVRGRNAKLFAGLDAYAKELGSRAAQAALEEEEKRKTAAAETAKALKKLLDDQRRDQEEYYDALSREIDKAHAKAEKLAKALAAASWDQRQNPGRVFEINAPQQISQRTQGQIESELRLQAFVETIEAGVGAIGDALARGATFLLGRLGEFGNVLGSAISAGANAFQSALRATQDPIIASLAAVGSGLIDAFANVITGTERWQRGVAAMDLVMEKAGAALAPLVDVIMPALFEAAKVLGTVVLGLGVVIGNAMNGFEVLFEGFANWWNSLPWGDKSAAKFDEKGSFDVDAMIAAIGNLWSMTYETAVAVVDDRVTPGLNDFGRALDEGARSVENYTAAILNAPTGFKVERLRFNASDALTSSPFLTAPAPTAGGAAPFYGDSNHAATTLRPPPPATIHVTNNITLDGAQIASTVETRTEYNQQVTTGLPVPPASRYLGYGGYGGIPGALPGGNY